MISMICQDFGHARLNTLLFEAQPENDPAFEELAITSVLD
jgi:hypothetical protein